MVPCHNRIFGVLFPQFQPAFYVFPKCCPCVLGHRNPLHYLLPPSSSKVPSLFDFHLASFLPLPYSFLCSARTVHPPLFFSHSQAHRNSFSASFTQACYKIGLSPSFCWFAKSLSALIKFSHTPSGIACAFLIPLSDWHCHPVCTTSNLLGALHSQFSPQFEHHKLQCFFFLLLSPFAVDTHQMKSSSGKQLQHEQQIRKRDTSMSSGWRDDSP